MPMRIAKPSKEDIDLACTISSTLDAIDAGTFPQNDDDEEAIEFDANNPEDLRKFYAMIMATFRSRPSGLSRVVMGMDTLMFNNNINPATPHLALHPDLKRLDKPAPGLLESMALRYRHDFGLLTAEEQRPILRSMEQLWEEVAGKGYYSYPDPG